MKELIEAAEFLLAALPEGEHEKYGGYRLGCTCPRCRLVLAVSDAKKQPPPAFPQRLPLTDEKILEHVARLAPYNDSDGAQVVWSRRALLAHQLGAIS